MAQWHAESNTSLSLHLKRWKSSNSIYLVFTQYRIVSPYHCDKGIEVIDGRESVEAENNEARMSYRCEILFFKISIIIHRDHLNIIKLNYY